MLANLIENEASLNSLSRESLLKLINLIPHYYDKNIIQLIDEKINIYKEEHHITISNMRINNLKSEIFKKKYKMMYDKLNYKIYIYEPYYDIWFSGREIEIEKLISQIKEDVDDKKFKMILISGRTINSYSIMLKENYIDDEAKTLIFNKLKRISRLDTIRMRFFFNITESEKIIKKKIKK